MKITLTKTAECVFLRKALEDLLTKVGFSDKDSIYLYDAKGNVDAARLWWLLRIYGFDKVALIDGGLTKWRVEGYTEEQGKNSRSTLGNFSFDEEEEMILSG